MSRGGHKRATVRPVLAVISQRNILLCHSYRERLRNLSFVDPLLHCFTILSSLLGVKSIRRIVCFVCDFTELQGFHWLFSLHRIGSFISDDGDLWSDWLRCFAIISHHHVPRVWFGVKKDQMIRQRHCCLKCYRHILLDERYMESFFNGNTQADGLVRVTGQKGLN